MLSLRYLKEQSTPQTQSSLADRIYMRAMARTQDPDQTEEKQVEDDAAQQLAQQKYSAKVAARVAEETNKDTELKQLNAAQAVLNKQNAQDTQALENGKIDPRVVADKKQQQSQEIADKEAQATQESIQDYI